MVQRTPTTTEPEAADQVNPPTGPSINMSSSNNKSTTTTNTANSQATQSQRPTSSTSTSQSTKPSQPPGNPIELLFENPAFLHMLAFAITLLREYILIPWYGATHDNYMVFANFSWMAGSILYMCIRQPTRDYYPPSPWTQNIAVAFLLLAIGSVIYTLAALFIQFLSSPASEVNRRRWEVYNACRVNGTLLPNNVTRYCR